MNRQPKPLIVMLLVITILVVCEARVWAQGEVLDQTIIDAEQLQKKGLSTQAIDELTTLNEAKNRHRPVVVNQAEVLKMLAAGYPEDVIRLFIGLDGATGGDEKIPLSPAQAMELTSAGVSFATIKIMLAGEMAKASSHEPVSQETDTLLAKMGHSSPQEPISQDADTPVAEIVPQTSPGDERTTTPKLPLEERSIQLGRQVVTHPDGRQEVVYSSPFGQADSGLGRQEVTGADGSQAIVYYSIGPGTGQTIYDEQTRRDYQRAGELLEKYR